MYISACKVQVQVRVRDRIPLQPCNRQRRVLWLTQDEERAFSIARSTEDAFSTRPGRVIPFLCKGTDKKVQFAVLRAGVGSFQVCPITRRRFLFLSLSCWQTHLYTIVFTVFSHLIDSAIFYNNYKLFLKGLKSASSFS